MTRTLTLAALAASLVASNAFAQVSAPVRNPAPAAGSASKLAVSDSLFALTAADGGMTELTLAELGVQKATDPALKQFSQRMIDEHSKMNADLKTLASEKGMSLPRGMSAGHEFCAQSLAGLSGEEFDKCYSKAQLVLHMSSLAAFEAEAERGQDPQVKALAAKGVNHIKEHLKEIKPIAMKYEKGEK